MKLGTLFSVNAIVAALFGLLFVLAPARTLSWYGVELNTAGLFIARLLGSAFLGFAVISWLVRFSSGSQEARAIALGFCVGDFVAFIFSLVYQLQGVANALGWSTVAIYLLLALGFGYFYFLKPAG